MANGHVTRNGRRIARGRAALGATALAMIVLLAGCGTSPGTGVSIDGVRYTTQDVLDRVADVLGPDATTDPDARAHEVRNQVTTLIRHQVSRTTAAKAGIVVTDADVNAFIAEYDDYQRTSNSPAMGSVLGVPQSDLADTVHDLLVFDKLMQAIPEGGADVTDVQVNVDVVQAATWADAVAARTRYVSDPAAMDKDSAAALAANPQLPGGAESLLKQPQHAVFGIFSAPAGEIIIVPQGQAGYLLVRVTDRVEKPGKLTGQMVGEAYNAAGLAGEISIASLLLGQAAEAADVTVNPRFGVWDPRIVQVIAGQ